MGDHNKPGGKYYCPPPEHGQSLAADALDTPTDAGEPREPTEKAQLGDPADKTPEGDKSAPEATPGDGSQVGAAAEDKPEAVLELEKLPTADLQDQLAVLAKVDVDRNWERQAVLDAILKFQVTASKD